MRKALKTFLPLVRGRRVLKCRRDILKIISLTQRLNNMSRRCFSCLRSLLVVAFLGLSGCAVNMPLSPDRPVTLGPRDGLAVFTMRLKNDFKNYLLTPRTIFVEASAVQGGKTYKFTFNEPEQKISDRELQMMGSFALPPGEYEITHFAGQTDVGFALLPVVGRFEPPFKRHFRVGDGEAVYLGHISARLVEKTSSDEERAGPIFPLLDQATTGMSSGTFKFEVLDRYAEDVPYIKTRFPSVAGRNFTKRLMTDRVEPMPSAPSQTEPVHAGEGVAAQAGVTRPSTIKAGDKQSDQCSVSQILEMKKLGLSDAQIKKSCS